MDLIPSVPVHFPISGGFSMSAKDWLLFLGPLLGVVIGGLITSLAKAIELLFQSKTESKNRRIERLEELFHAITRQLDELKSLGSRTLKIVLSENKDDLDYSFKTSELIVGFNSDMLVTARSVVLYCPHLTEEASLLAQRIGELIDALSSFVKLFANRQHLPTPAIANDKYLELKKPILELSQALSGVQSGLGRELHFLLEIPAKKDFWGPEGM